LTIEVSTDSSGRLVLDGDSEWRTRSLPAVNSGSIKWIRGTKKKTSLRFKGSGGKSITFVIRKNTKWEDALKEVLYPGGPTSGGVEERVNDLVAGFVENNFVGVLGGLDHEKQLEVGRALQKAGVYLAPTTSQFKSNTYLEVDLGAGGVVYNRQQVTYAQRVSRAIAERMLPVVRDWAYLFDEGDPIGGIKMTAQVAFKDPPLEYGSPEVDEIQVFTTIANSVAFSEYDITGQDLIDESIVLVNGNRTEVDLSEQ